MGKIRKKKIKEIMGIENVSILKKRVKEINNGRIK
jgi:hypothetical protein